jgi:hypothetical protein
MLEFAGLNARLCRTLLTHMCEFAELLPETWLDRKGARHIIFQAHHHRR